MYVKKEVFRGGSSCSKAGSRGGGWTQVPEENIANTHEKEKGLEKVLNQQQKNISRAPPVTQTRLLKEG